MIKLTDGVWYRKSSIIGIIKTSVSLKPCIKFKIINKDEYILGFDSIEQRDRIAMEFIKELID